jgi:hypothetical protein
MFETGTTNNIIGWITGIPWWRYVWDRHHQQYYRVDYWDPMMEICLGQAPPTIL